MDDIAKKVREHASGDHKRGCQGRCYSCECGYDEDTGIMLDAAAAEIERLTEAKRRALAIADERSKENVALREILRDARDHVPYDVLARIDAVLGNQQISR